MTPPVSYYVPSEQTSPKFAYAFAKGCGGEITDEDVLFEDRPVALFGSPARWPLLRAAQAAGLDWFYADHGYLGRGKYFRITKNAYQHDGRGEKTPDNWARFERFRRPIHPWRTSGQHVLVCPNSAVYFSLFGIDAEQWLSNVQDRIRAHTDREIRLRWKVQRRDRPIEQDLRNAWAVVVFSSAAAVDALIAGVPVFTVAPFAATYRMGLSDLARIEAPVFPPDRESFLAVLAANQFTIAEILSGQAWKHLQMTPAVAA
jgi:hypothetical protein